MQKLLLVFVLLAWGACSFQEKPKGVLTQAQLSALLLRVYLAEARLEAMPVTKDSSVRFFAPFEEKLLKSEGISDSTLKLTYSYYLAHPKELEQVYDAIIDTLVLREQRFLHGPSPSKPSLK